MKKLCSLLLSAVLLAALVVPSAAASNRYTDIPSGSLLAGEIESAAQYGLMNGMGDGTFGYYHSITRAQFATVLVRMFGWTQQTPRTASYTDVPMGQYWYTYVETAVANGVADAGGKFRPYDPITRGEMAVMLVRALGYQGVAARAASDTLPFSDVTSNRGYIAVAYAIGMTKGVTATTFAPNASATRAQAAAMLVRIYEKLHQETDWVHGFYAISSYSQIGLSSKMDAVSAVWSRMTYSSAGSVLSTTSANGNEFYVPNGYTSATAYLENQGTPMNLCVFMDTSVPSGSTNTLYAMLSTPESRTQAVSQILNELTTSYKAAGHNPYAGVTIDFEGLHSAAKSNFSAFLTELSQKLKAVGKPLYVCVSPVLTTGGYYDGYDYRTIGDLADKVILMAYDYDSRDLSGYVGTTYYKTTAPAPIDQVYESLKAITAPSTGVRDVSKIALGFSSKNTAWQVDAQGKLLSAVPVYPTNDTVYQRLSQAGTVQGWSQNYQMPYATYTGSDGNSYFLWYDNAHSVQARLQLAKLFGVSGVSLWRMGNIPVWDSWSWQSLLHS